MGGGGGGGGRLVWLMLPSMGDACSTSLFREGGREGVMILSSHFLCRWFICGCVLPGAIRFLLCYDQKLYRTLAGLGTLLALTGWLNPLSFIVCEHAIRVCQRYSASVLFLYHKEKLSIVPITVERVSTVYNFCAKLLLYYFRYWGEKKQLIFSSLRNKRKCCR